MDSFNDDQFGHAPELHLNQPRATAPLTDSSHPFKGYETVAFLNNWALLVGEKLAIYS